MNKSTIQDCIECFKQFDIQAYEEDGSVFVQTSTLDIFVEISEKEIAWRADQYLCRRQILRELQNQDV